MSNPVFASIPFIYQRSQGDRARCRSRLPTTCASSSTRGWPTASPASSAPWAKTARPISGRKASSTSTRSTISAARSFNRADVARLAAALLAILVLAGGPAAAVPDLAAQLLIEVNAARAQQGLAPLTRDPRLDRA